MNEEYWASVRYRIAVFSILILFALINIAAFTWIASIYGEPRGEIGTATSTTEAW